MESYSPFRSKQLLKWLNVDLLPVLESIVEEDREALRRFLGLKLSAGIGRRSTARIGLLLFEALKDGEATVNISQLARRAGIGRTAATRAVDYFRNPAEGVAKIEQMHVRRTGERRPGIYRIRPDLFDCGKTKEKSVSSASAHPSYTYVPREEEHKLPHLSEDKNTGAARAHFWQPTTKWKIAVRCEARRLVWEMFEGSTQPFRAVVADALVHHLIPEVTAGRLGPGVPFDTAMEEIIGKFWGADSLVRLLDAPEADPGCASWYRRDVFAAIGWLVRCWREERARQAEAWRQSAQAHLEFNEAKRECEADPLDFDVVATIRAETRQAQPEPPDPEPKVRDTESPGSVPEQEEQEFVSVRQLMDEVRTASESVQERPRKKPEKRLSRRKSEWCQMIDEFRKQNQGQESASVDHGDDESGDCRGNEAILRGDSGQ